MVSQLKGPLDKFNIIPRTLKKKKKRKKEKEKLGFYTIRNVGMDNNCMLSFTF